MGVSDHKIRLGPKGDQRPATRDTVRESREAIA